MSAGLPRLETARLVLRALAPEDEDFVFRHFSDPAVHAFLLDEDPLTTREQARELIAFYQDPAGRPYNRWVLALRADGAPVGTAGFHKWSRRNRRAEIGYDLAPAWWGRGLMAEALGALLRYGFETMDLHRVEALVAVENARSARLLEQLGFAREARLRDYFLAGGRFHDHDLFALLRPGWWPA